MKVCNLSQFKRSIAVGTSIQFLFNVYKPETANGQIRKVVKIQTNGLYTLTPSGRESWLGYPKAKDIRFNGDGTIDFIENGEVWLVIRLV